MQGGIKLAFGINPMTELTLNVEIILDYLDGPNVIARALKW